MDELDRSSMSKSLAESMRLVMADEEGRICEKAKEMKGVSGDGEARDR